MATLGLYIVLQLCVLCVLGMTIIIMPVKSRKIRPYLIVLFSILNNLHIDVGDSDALFAVLHLCYWPGVRDADLRKSGVAFALGTACVREDYSCIDVSGR